MIHSDWAQRWTRTVATPAPNLSQSVQRAVFSLFGLFYRLGIGVRNLAYDFHILGAHKVSVPVISIGNVSVGGTGKTPLVIWCAEQILARKKKPVVLSRGYGRKDKESYRIVSDGTALTADAGTAGDEPTLIAQSLKTVPVIVGADRVAIAKIAIEKFKPDCLILDDGFQHRRIHRDLDIVNFSEEIFLAPHLFPRGFLREPLSAARRGSFMVLKTKEREPDAKAQNYFERSHLPKAHFSYRPLSVDQPFHHKSYPVEWLKDKKVILFTAIAAPHALENLAKRLGAKVEKTLARRDHAYFSPAELQALQTEAKSIGAFIVTTEKDAVKMPPEFPCLVLKVGIDWVSGEKELKSAVLAAVS